VAQLRKEQNDRPYSFDQYQHMYSMNDVENGMCIQYEMVEILTEYYNYTLDNLISNKKELEEQ